MATTAERQRQTIRRFMTHRGLKIQPWCVDAKVSESTLRNFLAGRSESLTAGTLEKLAAAADSTVSELLGEHPHARGNRETVAIKGLRLEAAMGEQGPSVSEASDGESFYFRRDWIRNVVRADPDDLRVIPLGGDSMWPTLSDGDVALVKLQRSLLPPRAGIYCISDLAGDDLRVKRLETVPGKEPRIRIISDNRAYDPQEAAKGEIVIIGPVIWRGGMLG